MDTGNFPHPALVVAGLLPLIGGGIMIFQSFFPRGEYDDDNPAPGIFCMLLGPPLIFIALVPKDNIRAILFGLPDLLRQRRL